MKRKYVPTYLAHSVFEVDPSFYQRHGIRVILCDLDNTLASYKDPEPSERTKELILQLKKAGIRFCIASNNTSSRVRRFAQELDIEFFSGLAKPFAWRIRRLMAKMGFKKEETLLIGDQIMTDVQSANGAGIRCLLTDPLVQEDGPWTRINRFFERPKRVRIKEKGLAKSWKEEP